MNKSTRTIGIDSKAGRKSRTGSTVTMGITDLEAIECQQYFMAIEAGEEPTGRIKKIELVMYDDKEELETIESLKAEIKELKWCIESIDKVVENTGMSNKAVENSDQPLIEDIIIEQDEIPKLSNLKCTCGKAFVWKNVRWGEDYSNIIHHCECGCKTVGGNDLIKIVRLWKEIQKGTGDLKFFIENVLEEEFHEKPNEHLPASQLDLDIYEDVKDVE